MEKEISVGYVQGYNDASETMHHMIEGAVSRNRNPINIIDEVICGMYKQQEEVKEITNQLDKQIDESPDMFDDFGYEPQDIINGLIENSEDVVFTLTINGRLGGK